MVNVPCGDGGAYFADIAGAAGDRGVWVCLAVSYFGGEFVKGNILKKIFINLKPRIQYKLYLKWQYLYNSKW